MGQVDAKKRRNLPKTLCFTGEFHMTDQDSEEQKGEESTVEGTIKAVTGLIEKIPVYEDAFQPIAKETGKALGTVGKAVNAALSPLRGLVWGIEQIEGFVSNKVSEKLEKVPPENIQTPDPSVAGPALESLRFTGHKESLSELYANLLATSMDSETARNAHPGFVEIIRNLNSDEAKLLSYLLSVGPQPIIDIRQEEKSSGSGYEISESVCTLGHDASLEHRDLVGTYLDNLERLGLVEIPRGRFLTSDGVYDRILNDPPVKAIEEKINASENHKAAFVKYFVRLTQLGRLFGAACVKNKNET